MKAKKGLIRVIKDEKGFNLMEVALAMALLGIVAVAYLGALATGSRAIIIADERATAESLARTQMEDVRQQPYDGDNNPPIYSTILDIPDGYDITVSAERLDPYGDGTTNDDGIQSITVLIEHTLGGETKAIFSLEGYRAFR